MINQGDLWFDIYASKQNQSLLEWEVTGVEDHNGTPCMVLTKQRIKGLIPLAESGVNEADNIRLTKARLNAFLGQEISFIVTHTDKANNLFIASRSKAMEKQAAKAWENLELGDTATVIARRVIRKTDDDGKVTNIGIVTELEGIEVFLPVQELSHGWVEDLDDFAQPGDEIKVKVIELDKENKKLSISVKALIEGPWPGCVDRYSKGSMYVGTVTGSLDYGVFVSLEPGLDAFCKLPKAGRVNEGDSVSVVITRISPEEEKINGVIQRVVRKAV